MVEDLAQDADDRRRGPRPLLWPLAIFAILALLFAFALRSGDPSKLPSALIGKRVACVPGTAYATYALADARMAMPLADGVTAEQGASSFVNPMTALRAE